MGEVGLVPVERLELIEEGERGPGVVPTPQLDVIVAIGIGFCQDGDGGGERRTLSSDQLEWRVASTSMQCQLEEELETQVAHVGRQRRRRRRPARVTR